MNINWNTFEIVFGGLFLGGIFYYVIFMGPPSDQVYTSDSDGEIMEVQNYLSKQGIKTYTKNMSTYRSIMRFPGPPSLHVIKQGDKDNALLIIKKRRDHTDS